MRLIDADELLEDIANSELVWETYELLDVIEVLAVKKIIDDEPTVEERPKGKWTNGECKCPCCGEDKFKDLDADIWADWQPNFCPNCGADMRGDVI